MPSSSPRRLRLTVLGTGYLGATHAACMAELGFEVLGLDVDPNKIDALSHGKAPFFEPKLEEMLARHVKSGRLRFTTSHAEVAAFGDVHFLCVGTPQQAEGTAADMSQVFGTVEALAEHLDHDCLIVGKSTVPVGTAAKLTELLAAKVGDRARVDLAWNPEFLRESHAVDDTLTPDRIVVGVTNDHALELLKEVYSTQIAAGVPFLDTDYATAELVKVAANSFLATKISFINAMAEVCEAAGADVARLAEALGKDERIGPKFLAAGAGFGGGCLPKDIRAFQARATELGVGDALKFLGEVDKINDRRRDKIIELATAAADGDVTGKRIAIWGATFKPNSDDIRSSVAMYVARELASRGACVVVYDPEGMANAKNAAPELGFANSALDAARDAHAVLLLTEWAEFREIDPARLAQVMAAANVIDGRNHLDAAAYRDAGIAYTCLGRPNLSR